MPRLTRDLLRRARAIDPLLPLLLRPCRNLSDAQNELRWLRESLSEHTPASQQQRLKHSCIERSRGRPLQYIIGNQPFGDLDLLCRPGVLIPRPETESYTTFLARYIQQMSSLRRDGELRILDLCTGTGCIALLLHSLLSRSHAALRIHGVDISRTALRLARENLAHNVRSGNLEETALSQVQFGYGNVLEDACLGQQEWDVVISNPPYISQTSFNQDTSRSARNFEPRLALVPAVGGRHPVGGLDLSGDVFFQRVVDIARSSAATIVVMEVADEEQSQRVLRATRGNEKNKYWKRAAVWHDNLYNADCSASRPVGDSLTDVDHIGTGNFRAVVLATE